MKQFSMLEYPFEEEKSGNTKQTSGSERTNILIVDDLAENRMAYGSILEELDQNLMMAPSGEEALRLLLQHEFAVILLDVNIPGMDGFEIASLIRKRRKCAHTPIIFLTAFTDEVRMAQGYASGAVDYLPTPVVPEILQAKVRVFIELSQMRSQAALQAEEHARRTAAEEADRRKDEFLGMLAHELRNPLAPILNASYLLRRMANNDSRLEELGCIVDRQVKHMTRLLDDLLDATRLAHGKVLLKKERCDLAKIVHQTAEDYSSIFEAGNLTLHIHHPSLSLWMEGDPVRLAQVIGNLLHNAHKFTNAGGHVTVSIAHSSEDNYGVITITDTGIGIGQDILPHVFDVFRQGEQGLERTHGGLGLGLALVKGLVELHGGTVSVDSEGVGKGTSFTIQLPIVSTDNVTTTDVTEKEIIQDGQKHRILLIEDNQVTAKSTQSLLSFDSYEVHIAFNGSDGLEAAKTFRPEVILCDIGLPGMDGYQVARAIREESSFSSVYMIALTGYGREKEIKQAQDAGFDMHMTKPVDYEKLQRTLVNILINNKKRKGIKVQHNTLPG